MGFHDTLSQLRLKMFSSLLKVSSVSVDSTKIVLKANRNLFARMVIIAQSRLLNMADVLCHELGPLPWSLATGGGCPAKTDKAKMLHLLEDGIAPAEDIPARAAVIVDAMAVLQSLVKPAATFGGVAQQVFRILAAHIRVPGSRVDFVIDRYLEYSIKGCERQRRTKQRGTVRIRILSAVQKTPSQ